MNMWVCTVCTSVVVLFEGIVCWVVVVLVGFILDIIWVT